MGQRNEMRHICAAHGCFNLKHRPKIEIFHECFPGKINFTDIDGCVEIAWNFAYLEWKRSPIDWRHETGQRILYERRTQIGSAVVFCVAGDAETMEISHIGRFWRGKFYGWHPATLTELKIRLKNWAEWARKNPAFPGKR